MKQQFFLGFFFLVFSAAEGGEYLRELFFGKILGFKKVNLGIFAAKRRIFFGLFPPPKAVIFFSKTLKRTLLITLTCFHFNFFRERQRKHISSLNSNNNIHSRPGNDYSHQNIRLKFVRDHRLNLRADLTSTFDISAIFYDQNVWSDVFEK